MFPTKAESQTLTIFNRSAVRTRLYRRCWAQSPSTSGDIEAKVVKTVLKSKKTRVKLARCCGDKVEGFAWLDSSGDGSSLLSSASQSCSITAVGLSARSESASSKMKQ